MVEELNKWYYTPAPWYDFRYTGGTFFHPRVWDEMDRNLPEELNDALQWAINLADKSMDWAITTKYGRTMLTDLDLEILVIKFKKPHDAIQFKLLFT